jgi:uncharacterized FlaG/YvyC family protein
MKIYTTLKIGDHHTNHCEDYLITAELSKYKVLCAVMDGCSMGTDSHFASTLTGKILKKISKEHRYKEFVSKKSDDSKHTLEEIVNQLFQELRGLKNSLQLEREEVLNTLLISIIDTRDCTGEFLCIGDGLICINNQFSEFEQNDKPDYLGYHLEEDFNDWYKNQKQRISVQGIKDFSLATDGIFTFKKFDNKIYPEPEDIVNFLLVNAEGSQNPIMLDRKVIEIQTDWGLKPTDDLAIVRGIL